MERIEYVDRVGTNCEKWGGDQVSVFGEGGLLGMWVADMDFKAPECVRKALRDYVDLGVYGYASPSVNYFQSFIDWELAHHNYEVRKEWLRFSPGVVPGINWVMHLKTHPGDAVIVLTPVYYPFLHSIRDNGRKLVSCELINDHGRYSIDYADFERKITENDVRLFILCSPHNPVGRIWTKDELSQLLEICRRHHVFVISDEIHHDLEFAGHRHTPTASVGNYDDMLVSLTAPSKTFNLAGFQNSIIIIPDDCIRAEFDSYQKTFRVLNGNDAGYIAAEAAYRGGEDWLQQVKEIIYGNYRFLTDALSVSLPQVTVTPLEGTYLAWLDFSAYLKPDEMVDFFQKKCRIAFDYGEWFGGDAKCFIRVNLATSRENIEECLHRITENLK